MLFRLFFTYVLPLVAPALLYLLWNWIQMRRTLAGKRAEPPPSLERMPWLILLGAGISLVAVTLLAVTLAGDAGRPGETYMPPRFEDGRIVPGRTGGN